MATAAGNPHTVTLHGGPRDGDRVTAYTDAGIITVDTGTTTTDGATDYRITATYEWNNDTRRFEHRPEGQPS